MTVKTTPHLPSFVSVLPTLSLATSRLSTLPVLIWESLVLTILFLKTFTSTLLPAARTLQRTLTPWTSLLPATSSLEIPNST